ncbi:MAG: HEAT repeat domain-containing protein, partial [Thermoplasmata archaeon]
GVGKTALLFACFDKMIVERPCGILITHGISGYHHQHKIRLFYDDLPENTELVKAIEENNAKGIIITAREQDFKNMLSSRQQSLFRRIYIRNFSPTEMKKVCENLLEMEGIKARAGAVEKLVEYSQGSPVYVWSVVRELRNAGLKELTREYLEEHTSPGMEEYVETLLSKLLRSGDRFKDGAVGILASLIFIARHTRGKECPCAYYHKVSKLLHPHVVRLFGDNASGNRELEDYVLSYLAGTGSIYRFPHDTWADVLENRCSRTTVFRPLINRIITEFEGRDEEKSDLSGISSPAAGSSVFLAVKSEALKQEYERIHALMCQHAGRHRGEVLDFLLFALKNFQSEELEAAGLIINIAEFLARETGDRRAETALSILNNRTQSSPASTSTIINIQDSVIIRSNILQSYQTPNKSGIKGSQTSRGEGNTVSVRDSILQRSTVVSKNSFTETLTIHKEDGSEADEECLGKKTKRTVMQKEREKKLRTEGEEKEREEGSVKYLLVLAELSEKLTSPECTMRESAVLRLKDIAVELSSSSKIQPAKSSYKQSLNTSINSSHYEINNCLVFIEEALIRALGDDFLKIRLHAASGLGTLVRNGKFKELIIAGILTALSECLRDAELLIRKWAIEMIGDMVKKGLIKKTASLVSEGKQLHPGTLSNERPSESLLTFQADESRNICDASKQSRLTTSQIKDIFRGLLEGLVYSLDEEELTLPALTVLNLLLRFAEQAGKNPVTETLDTLQDFFSDEDNGGRILLCSKHKNSAVRQETAEVIGRTYRTAVRESQISDASRKAISILKPLLRDSEGSVRSKTAWAMRCIAEAGYSEVCVKEGVVALLKAIYLKDADRKAREQAKAALIAIQNGIKWHQMVFFWFDRYF